MAFDSNDINIHESQDLTDNDSGGGKKVATTVQSGQVNNLFNKPSRINEVYGAVSMRKAFLSLDTANTDVLFGTHVILTNPPEDDRVNVLMMSRNDPYDTRDQAADYIESYLIRSVVSDIRLYGNQPQGGRILLCLQVPGAVSPSIGDVFNIVTDEGLASEVEQYVRVQDISETIQKFDESFDLKVLTITITEPLKYAFLGGEPDKGHHTALQSDSSRILLTAYNPLAKYYGTAALTVDANSSDSYVNIGSIYQSIVPSNRSETPLSDQSLAGNATIYYPLAEVTDELSAGATTLLAHINSGATLFTGRPIARGSVTLNCSVTESWIDDGEGLLVKSGSTDSLVIDYVTGSIANPEDNDQSCTFLNLVYKPAVAISDQAYTSAIDITEANQAFNYIKTLAPNPYPESLIIDYMAGGRWYRLRTDHNGDISGEADNTGTGTLTLATGTAQITLPVFPDVGTKVIYSYGGQQHYQNNEADVAIKPPKIQHTLENACYPGSLVITWTSSGITKTATDDSAGGISGDATGRVVYSTGQLSFSPKDLPDSTTNIVFDYDIGLLVAETFIEQDADVSGNIVLTLGSLPVKPGSIDVSFASVHTRQVLTAESETRTMTYRAGSPDMSLESTELTVFLGYSEQTETSTLQNHLLDTATGGGLGEFSTRVGSSVNYATGELVFAAIAPTPSVVYVPAPGVREWEDKSTETDVYNSTVITVTYLQDTGTPTSTQETIPVPALVLAAAPTSTYGIVPNSLKFDLGGDSYTDLNGLVYQNGNVLAGSIDYQAAEVTLDLWTGAAAGFSVKTLLTRYGDWTEYNFVFRTAGAPLLNQSFYLQSNSATDGSFIQATADASGVLSDTLLAGNVDINTGIAQCKFGQYVVAAGNEGEEWYDADELDGNGNVWKPEPITLSSARYNAVVLTYLPLDADIIGLDAIRLPADGKVQVFNAGDVAVLQATDVEAFSGATSAGAVHNLTGSDYDLIELQDADGLIVPASLYTADLVTMTVTMADPLDLTGLTEPLVAKKMREDMLLITRVDITGQINFSAPPSRAYAASNSRLSNALIHGDLAARYENFFDQETWTAEWSDTLIGNESTATYNVAVFPLQLENDSAVTEDWAIRFINTSDVEVIGRNVGNLGSFPIASNIAPINPETGKAYFTLLSAGFGSGWAANNVIRFKTISADCDVWFIRATLPGPSTLADDNFIVQVRGDRAQ